MRQRPGIPPSLYWFIVICGASLVIWLAAGRKRSPFEPRLDPSTQHRLDEFKAIEARETQMDRTYWAKEQSAQNHGKILDTLWNWLNTASNRIETLEAWPVESIVLPVYNPPALVSNNVLLHTPSGKGRELGTHAWRDFLAKYRADGWTIHRTEFRHNRFDPPTTTDPARSFYYFSAHLVRLSPPARAIIEGTLKILWVRDPSLQEGNEGERGEFKLPASWRIDGRDLTLKTREGPPPFEEALSSEISPPDRSYFIDPLILGDLDEDGLPEIILAASNTLIRRRADGTFAPQPFSPKPPGLIFTGLLADFDGDDREDFLGARFEGLILFKGVPGGALEPERPAWVVQPHLRYAQAMTCGDIDGDGDLDVWLGQYKVPYENGQMPTPFDAANDGHPAYLLVNDGRAKFTDATAGSGLEKKRWRRSYSASFVDWDQDGDLDLVVVSDFAGLDAYANDGRGKFTDVTSTAFTEPRGFGMAHALADFNRDGHVDLLMIGMNSPTVSRLDRLNLTRPDASTSDFQGSRTAMTHGNRLYLWRPGNTFAEGPLGQTIAQSGWSWGCGAADFDNDGWVDAYIANGHESRGLVDEYEPHFWLHDIYVGASAESVPASAYFRAKFARTRGKGMSYGGYEKNRLFFNQTGTSFLEAAHLMGLGLEEDCRNVVAADLDADGRMDLLVTTFEVHPRVRQTLRVFMNRLPGSGNWIGVSLRGSGGTSPIGATVKVRTAERTLTGVAVTGDSYRSQRPRTLHFGLGENTSVDSIEVSFPNRPPVVVKNPSSREYHTVTVPPAGGGEH